jgi:chaperone LolA
MKHLLTAIGALLMMYGLPGNVSAQDARAQKVIQTAQKKMAQLKSLKANFTIKIVGSNGRAQATKKGSFAMKGEQYHITLPGQEIMSDGKTVWTWIKEAKEVQVSNSNASEESLSPARLFTNIYDKDYSYRYLSARKVAGKACDIIELTPKKAGPFTRVELAIDKSGHIAGGTMFEKNGSRYEYEVSSATQNPSLPDSLFSFDTKAHPGVEIVDLR